MDRLPIAALATDFERSLQAGPVVVCSPTGSGKSTLVPQWCARLRGRTLVVEPRRVACRSLARHVAASFGTALGEDVGYVVRHDERLSARSRIAFVTPGIALRMVQQDGLAGFATVVLDEFHERSLDLDLLLALLSEGRGPRLVVMSATLDAERLAAFLGGQILRGEGRQYPVTLEYDGEPLLPSERDLERRVAAAVRRLRDRPGDLLVFLPGKAEIAACQAALAQEREFEVLPLHAQLPAAEQDRVFDPGTRRRVILSTNVAETSVTLPGIGVVIDSGLVRQTRYRGSRGYLTLAPLALDAAEQRRGRGGRLLPGHCLRLWSEAAILEEQSLPEIHREALPTVVLACAACGRRASELRFLDPPKPYALEAAERELQGLGALDDDFRITALGRQLFELPLDPQLGRVLLQAPPGPTRQDAVDLIAAVACGRPLFAPGPRPSDPEDDLRAAGCDASAAIAALRRGQIERHRLAPGALNEARRIAQQLRSLLRLPAPDPLQPPEREALARCALEAVPDLAYLPRRRKRAVAWANGREELELGQGSALREDAVAAVVLDRRALTLRGRKTVQVITCAIPCTLASLRAAGLGEWRVSEARLEGGRLVADAILSYAGAVLQRREEEPHGPLARAALLRLLTNGSFFAAAVAQSRERIAAIQLWERLRGEGRRPELEPWLAQRLDELGFEGSDDLALLLPEDFVHPDLPPSEREWLDRNYPRSVSVGDARYEVEYDPQRMEATLVKGSGGRGVLPNLVYLPEWPGWRLLHRDRNVLRPLRERR